MELISVHDGVDAAFNAIVEGRLVTICGAGLSMSEPSNIPSAPRIAIQAKQKYESIYGTTNGTIWPSGNISVKKRHYLEQVGNRSRGLIADL